MQIKCRYRILTGQTTVRSKEIIREVCTANYVDIVRGNITPDHISTDVEKYIEEQGSSHSCYNDFNIEFLNS
ncbi:MAG: transposase [Wolbachia sp.]|nr:transposase [Wolbachia sp.]MDD9336153.1 transposase [Wolbachia sp.]